jgi:hypothetical protein
VHSLLCLAPGEQFFLAWFFQVFLVLYFGGLVFLGTGFSGLAVSGSVFGLFPSFPGVPWTSFHGFTPGFLVLCALDPVF